MSYATPYKKLKIAMIGAGSVSFCPATLSDIVLSDMLNTLPIEVVLMDIDGRALEVSEKFAKELVRRSKRDIKLWATLNLKEAVQDADFVITAIEKDRYHYWSQDFHIPYRYGFRQVYGENGGPGGMFHFLRNVGPMLEIARTMEQVCPNAYLINYTNPEAKLVEAITKLTSIKAVGVCHGFAMGVGQIAKILKRNEDELDVTGYGLNHFGFMTSIKDKKTGEDLYPLFRQKEAEGHWLAEWDELGLSRIMFRTFGLWPYPGTNHIGEYIAWSDEFLASSKIQYFFDPVKDKPWETKDHPTFVYSFSSNPTAIHLDHKDADRQEMYEQSFEWAKDDDRPITGSSEYGIPIIEAIVFDLNRYIPSLNMLNKGTMDGLMQDMCLEGPCIINKDGIHPQPVPALPTAIESMINKQGYVHKLVIEAYEKMSRNVLLQAMMIDPTVSTYNNAVAVINEIFELQKELIAPLKWD